MGRVFITTSKILRLLKADALTWLGTKCDIPIFQAELEVQQRHEFFTKYHPHHLSRGPIA
jgi:hypothetical protein